MKIAVLVRSPPERGLFYRANVCTFVKIRLIFVLPHPPRRATRMCTTDYIKERAQEIERAAQNKINIIDDILPAMAAWAARTEALPRAGGLLVLLLHMQAELMEEKAAALRVIESALELRRTTKDLVF